MTAIQKHLEVNLLLTPVYFLILLELEYDNVSERLLLLYSSLFFKKFVLKGASACTFKKYVLS